VGCSPARQIGQTLDFLEGRTLTILLAILGVLIGLTVGSAVAVLALSGRFGTAYWDIADRHPFIRQLVRLSIIALIVACCSAFGYLGYQLAE
jgi:ABC-type amino acid transport system permease subunit